MAINALSTAASACAANDNRPSADMWSELIRRAKPISEPLALSAFKWRCRGMSVWEYIDELLAGFDRDHPQDAC